MALACAGAQDKWWARRAGAGSGVLKSVIKCAQNREDVTAILDFIEFSQGQVGFESGVVALHSLLPMAFNLRDWQKVAIARLLRLKDEDGASSSAPGGAPAAAAGAAPGDF